MRNRWIKYGFILFTGVMLLGVIPVEISGQVMDNPPPSGDNPRSQYGQKHHNRPGRGPDDEKVREMMMSLKIWKLTEALEVDEALAAKLYPRIREMENLRFNGQKEMENKVKEIKQAVESKVDSRVLEPLVNEFHALMIEQREKEQQNLESIMKLLTVEQQAKFILVESEFHQDIKKFVRERRRTERGNRNR